MKEARKTKAQLLSELEELRHRVGEFQESETELKRTEEVRKVKAVYDLDWGCFFHCIQFVQALSIVINVGIGQALCASEFRVLSQSTKGQIDKAERRYGDHTLGRII